MRDYEIATILNLDLDESGLAALTEAIEGWIVAAGGEVAVVDDWGRRKLAYPIMKRQEGRYVFWYAVLPPTAPAELERQMSLNEDVLRFMVTRAEAPPPPKEEKVMEEGELEVQSVDESDTSDEIDADGSATAKDPANSEPESTENEGDESVPVA
jgi:small subunit ribosomal protein S6